MGAAAIGALCRAALCAIRGAVRVARAMPEPRPRRRFYQDGPGRIASQGGTDTIN
jgi:hypothetical protein